MLYIYNDGHHKFNSITITIALWPTDDNDNNYEDKDRFKCKKSAEYASLL